MEFEIPAVPIGDLSQQALQRHLDSAAAAYRVQFSAATAARAEGTLTAEMVDALASLNTWITDARAQLATFAATSGQETSADAEGSASERLASFGSEGGQPGTQEPTPGIADAAAQTGGASVRPREDASEANLRFLTASASLAGHSHGERLTLDAAVDMLMRRLGAIAPMVGGKTRHSESLFQVHREVNPFEVHSQRSDADVLRAVCDEARLPAGSLMEQFRQAPLTASGGWCAPSTTDLTIRTTYTNDGTISLPTVSAPRGGIFTMPELVFTTVNGGYTGTNFWNMTEAQVIAATPKTFIEINCPTPTEVRLGVDGVGIIGNLLALRGYPEYAREFISGAQLALSLFESNLQIAGIATGSTGVDLSAIPIFATDGSVFSTTLAAVGMAAVDIRSNKRMARDATLEVILPDWWIEDARADLMRRPSIGDDPVKADAMIVAEFAKLHVAPQFVRGYQDGYSVVAGTVGAAAPITAFPTTLKFLIYPAGTWVVAQTPVIDLSTVYDATRLANNQDLELFHEVGWGLVRRLATSREYTVPICPTGGTGQPLEIVCASGPA